MYRLEREAFTRSPYIYFWGILGFQAGFLNAFGFLACGRYVSHVTGFGTQIGIALGGNQFSTAIELLGFPFFFIAGSWLNGVCTVVRIERGKVPRYDLIMLLLPLIMVLLLIADITGVLDPFGDQIIETQDMILLFLLSFVCGLQNGCFATMTKGQIRTTHLTGIATDMGTDLARTMFGKLASQEHQLTKRANISRFVTFLCFTGGSIFSVLATERYEYISLVVPIVSSLVVFFSIRRVAWKVQQVLLGDPMSTAPQAVSEASPS